MVNSCGHFFSNRVNSIQGPRKFTKNVLENLPILSTKICLLCPKRPNQTVKEYAVMVFSPGFFCPTVSGSFLCWYVIQKRRALHHLFRVTGLLSQIQSHRSQAQEVGTLLQNDSCTTHAYCLARLSYAAQLCYFFIVDVDQDGRFHFILFFIHLIFLKNSLFSPIYKEYDIFFDTAVLSCRIFVQLI